MKPDAILTADLHIRDTIPECRIDDFIEAQTKKLLFLKKLQEEYNVPVLVAGDIFHHWKPNPWLISYALNYLPDGLIGIPGQHDLPAHNMDNFEKCGLNTLAQAGKIHVLINDSIYKHRMLSAIVGFPWGMELRGTTITGKYRIAIIHHLVYKGIPPFPGAENVGGTARSIIKKMKGFDLIVSGDNHQTFVEEYNGRLLVNPGSFMRTTAAQIDHKPCVFLWEAKTNGIEQVFLPIEKNVISRDHIDLKKQRNERIDAFIDKLEDDVEIGFSFEKNMTEYLSKNKIPKDVEKIIWEVLRGN